MKKYYYRCDGCGEGKECYGISKQYSLNAISCIEDNDENIVDWQEITKEEFEDEN